MTQNKYLTPKYLKYYDAISAKSPAQMLSLNLAYTFLLLNFLITGLCNSIESTSFKFDILLLIAPDPKLSSKNLYTILANPL